LGKELGCHWNPISLPFHLEEESCETDRYRPQNKRIKKGLQIMGLKQKSYSNSFQVVVTPLDVIVVSKILHEPNVAIDVCRRNVVAESNHELIHFYRSYEIARGFQFDEQKECSFHWRVGSNVNRNVAFAFAFHRIGVGLNYSITVEKKNEDLQVFNGFPMPSTSSSTERDVDIFVEDSNSWNLQMLR
jgi:hypothetical protein